MGKQKAVEGEVVTNAVGRPPKFSNAEDLAIVFENWKKEFDTGGKYADDIPDVEGFCDYIDSYRDLFSAYEKKEEFSDTIKRIKNWIYYKKKQLAMKGSMNATVFIFDAKNNAGYVDKTEQDVKHEMVQPILGAATKQIEDVHSDD